MERGGGGDEEEIVCLDESFFINDNYQLTRFTFGSQVLELYCLQSASNISWNAKNLWRHRLMEDGADFDLTGQLVWPGAELLNDYLSKNADMLRGCSVIELGSGVAVGITGILCSRYCKKVVMTDHNDEVLKILARNIELHDSSPNLVRSAEMKAEKLEWGNSEQLASVLERHPEGLDLVLGADIYILFCTIHVLLAAYSCFRNVLTNIWSSSCTKLPMFMFGLGVFKTGYSEFRIVDNYIRISLYSEKNSDMDIRYPNIRIRKSGYPNFRISENPDIKNFLFSDFSDRISDILNTPSSYDANQFTSFQQSSIPLLFDTVEKLLQFSRGKKSRFILAYVSRAKGTDNMVIREATRHGLSISEVAGTRATVRNLEGCIYEITDGRKTI
ncbi:hypothetical protein OROMI_029652 [Orobanche minor]